MHSLHLSFARCTPQPHRYSILARGYGGGYEGDGGYDNGGGYGERRSAYGDRRGGGRGYGGGRGGRGGRGRGRGGPREGDWACPSCEASNFSFRTECYQCYEPRPASAGAPPPARVYEPRERAPGDWDCPACGVDNFARRLECFKCGEPHPDPDSVPERVYREPRQPRRDWNNEGGYEARAPRPGNWDCPACGCDNFGFRTECFQCGDPRGDAPDSQRGRFDRFDNNQSREQSLKPGDWMCPECNGHNFARRMDCFKCQAPRPEETMPDR